MGVISLHLYHILLVKYKTQVLPTLRTNYTKVRTLGGKQYWGPPYGLPQLQTIKTHPNEIYNFYSPTTILKMEFVV